jgi:hypothetical protein
MQLPRSQKTLSIDLPFELALPLVERALTKMGTRITGMDPRNGVVLARTKFSLKSWGEHILITVVDNFNGCTLKITSESSVITTWQDWGRNANNLERFEQIFQQLAGELLEQNPSIVRDLAKPSFYERGKERSHEKGKAQDPSPYEILNLQPGASEQEIEKAYRAMIKMYHPDRVEGLGPEFKTLADQRSKAINAAYEQLKKNIKG